MNSELKAFVDAERKRVIEPAPNFAKRVVARLQTVGPEIIRPRTLVSIWDTAPGAARPVLALAAMMILAFLVIQSVIPAVQQAPADDILTVGSDVLSSDEAFVAMMDPEGGL